MTSLKCKKENTLSLQRSISLILLAFLGTTQIAHAITVTEAVNSLQSSTSGLPSVDNPKGNIGYILANIFYTTADGSKNGLIRPQYLDGIGTWTSTGANAYFSYTGSIGIGTSTPGQKLDVAGNIRSSGQIMSTVANGTSPLAVTSTTLVSNLNADQVDGLSVNSTTTNNQVNSIVRTDGSGYTNFGWINTASGDNGTTAPTRIYASHDGYIRYYSPTNFRQVLDVPTRGGTGATGTWSIGITGNALGINSQDTRATNELPQAVPTGISANFKQNTTNGLSDGGTYNGVISFRSYGTSTDLSGGPILQLAYTNSGNLWTRFSTNATTWGSWSKIGGAGSSFTGTLNYIPKFTSGTTIGNSNMVQSGVTLGIGISSLDQDYSLQTAKDVEINGVHLGKGGGNIYGNTALGSWAMNSNSTGQYNTAVGEVALLANTTGSYNTAIGEAALNANTTGNSNTALGQSALLENESGLNNTAIGQASMYFSKGIRNTAVGMMSHNANVWGESNVAMGMLTLGWGTSGDNNTAIGTYALRSNETSDSTAVGYGALMDNTTGWGNNAIGSMALAMNTTGWGNHAMGIHSLLSNTTGGANVAIGTWSLENNTTGSDNVAVGLNTLSANTTGGGHVAIGRSVLSANTSANGAVGVGYEVLSANTSGDFNVGMGFQALKNNTTGSHNIGIGLSSLFASNGSYNTSVGSMSLQANTSGSENTTLGTSSLYTNTTGSQNVSIGKNAMFTNLVGSQNVSIGVDALYNAKAGTNTAIGYNAGSMLTTGTGNIFIGANVQANIGNTSSNQLNIGNWIYGNNGKIGIGVANPSVKLQVGTGATDGVQVGYINFNSSTAAKIDEYFGIRANLTDSAGGSGFRVNNSTTQIFAVKSNGNVGIATDAPSSKLHITGNENTTAGTNRSSIRLEDTGTQSWTINAFGSASAEGGGSFGINQVGTGNRFIITSAGKVGIGVSNPSSAATLEVGGQVKINGGSPGAGKVLTSDATGLATWESNSAVDGTYEVSCSSNDNNSQYHCVRINKVTGVTEYKSMNSGTWGNNTAPWTVAGAGNFSVSCSFLSNASNEYRCVRINKVTGVTEFKSINGGAWNNNAAPW